MRYLEKQQVDSLIASGNLIVLRDSPAKPLCVVCFLNPSGSVEHAIASERDVEESGIRERSSPTGQHRIAARVCVRMPLVTSVVLSALDVVTIDEGIERDGGLQATDPSAEARSHFRHGGS